MRKINRKISLAVIKLDLWYFYLSAPNVPFALTVIIMVFLKKYQGWLQEIAHNVTISPSNI